jgi:hypothetical protein
MSVPEFTKSEIEDYRNHTEIIRLTAEQVIKDFALFGLEIGFSGDIINAYDELFEQLNSCLVDLLNSDYRRLLSLLYHIDISEKEMNKKLTSNADEPSEIITEMILERELKKVIIRKYYRG